MTDIAHRARCRSSSKAFLSMGTHILPLLVALLSALSQSSEAYTTVRRSLGQEAECQPWAVPVADRCSYVRNNSAVCFPDGGIQQYLQVHYCDFGQAWQVASFGLLLLAMTICLGFLLTAAERFFCPSLELISDYLRLPPAVAGATLLSFGNGAPDVFTQLAAVQGENPATLGITLAEPLGGGLFTSNVVLGAVVLLSSRSQTVSLRPAPFLKDLLFYLAALSAVLLFMRDGKVHLWETGMLLLLYVLYVLVTFYVCRGDEPVHADHHHHELPLEELQGEVDTCSLCDSEHESPRCKQHAAAWMAAGAWDQAAQQQQADADDLSQPLLPTVQAAVAPLGAEVGRPHPAEQHHDSGHLVVAVNSDSGASSPQGQYHPPSSTEASPSGRAAVAAADVEAAAGSPPPRPARQVLQRRVSFADKPSILEHPVLPPIRCCSPGSEGGAPSSNPDVVAPQEASWGSVQPGKQDAVEGGPVRQLRASTSMVVHQGETHHVPSWHSWLQRPFVLVLATTMPRVGSSHAHHYPYWRAALLPFTTPLFVLLVIGIRVPPALSSIPLQLVLAWFAGAAALALALRRVYPRDGFPYGRLLGAMACVSFCLSVMWLNVAASLLVELCVVLGKIWGISPALLGATVLAWGNSMPDLVNNVAMGRDGFPVMAITACFASPMFSLLVGMGTALTVGAVQHGGELVVRVSKPLLVMYGFAAFNLVKYLLLVPLLYGYVLRRSLAILAFCFYLCFNVVYMLVQARVL